ncbi:hypothetical protein Bpfe_027393 [Biomphalaria pfeifferi]|uniref:Uncharacterized protein n=1 Tax=Biomphalaria pfeifferi TaxID=112525 RepID=A0AAD8AY77_BIOPF|nr:hypothetical protein Bpfe_027393 [Biomphalaria pfeifferi]
MALIQSTISIPRSVSKPLYDHNNNILFQVLILQRGCVTSVASTDSPKIHGNAKTEPPPFPPAILRLIAARRGLCHSSFVLSCPPQLQPSPGYPHMSLRHRHHWPDVVYVSLALQLGPSVRNIDFRLID